MADETVYLYTSARAHGLKVKHIRTTTSTLKVAQLLYERYLEYVGWVKERNESSPIGMRFRAQLRPFEDFINAGDPRYNNGIRVYLTSEYEPPKQIRGRKLVKLIEEVEKEHLVEFRDIT
jgi:hypothetical protein